MRWMMRLGVSIVRVVVVEVDRSKNSAKSKNFKNPRPKTIRCTEELSFLDPDGQPTSDYDKWNLKVYFSTKITPIETYDAELLALSRLPRLQGSTQKAAGIRLSFLCIDTKSLSFCWNQKPLTGQLGLEEGLLIYLSESIILKAQLMEMLRPVLFSLEPNFLDLSVASVDPFGQLRWGALS